MIFRAEFTPKPFKFKITHNHNLLLAGSCFTEQIGNRLQAAKFSVLQNPNGILFNPVSIANSLSSYTEENFSIPEMFFYNELWHSWDHHSVFSHPDKKAAVDKIQKSHQDAHEFLKSADFIFLTVGSACVYERRDSDNKVAANCHKIPADKFNRRLLSVSEIVDVFQEMIRKIRALNSGVNFIFTVSPVRHLREGFIENNRSKAALIQAVHEIVNDNDRVYFPAYELVIDDLRDYRFYAEDLTHPNYFATNYVWEKFALTAFDQSTQSLLNELTELRLALNHKPFNPNSEAHKKFLASSLEKTKRLAERFPNIDLVKELEYFSS